MFFKKRKRENKQVICPDSVMIEIMQECIHIDAGMSEFIIQIQGEKHNVGFTSDFNNRQGFFNPLFYLDEQEFDTFEQFKEQAVLNGRLFAQSTDEIEIIEADKGVSKFPWYTMLENYIVKQQ